MKLTTVNFRIIEKILEYVLGIKFQTLRDKGEYVSHKSENKCIFCMYDMGQNVIIIKIWCGLWGQIKLPHKPVLDVPETIVAVDMRAFWDESVKEYMWKM